MSHDRAKAREIIKLNTIPRLVTIQKIELQSSADALHRRRISSAEILLVLEGIGKFSLNNKDYILEKGDLLLLNEGESFRMQAQDGVFAVYLCGIDSFQYVNGMLDQLREKPEIEIVKTAKYFNRIESFCTELYLENKNKTEGSAEVISANLMLLLVYVRRACSGAEHHVLISPVSMCRQLRDYIDTHFGSPITLRSLADMFFVSPDYVSHVFKSEIGESPIHYLINCRIREAKRLLIYTNMTLREISTIVGYDNMTHFSSLFKKSTGFSPGRYRQEERKKTDYK